MKKLVVFVAVCFLACSFLLTAQPVAASTGDIDTSWQQLSSEDPIFTFNFSFEWDEGTTFGIFDVNSIDTKVLLFDSFGGSARITAAPNVSSGWDISVNSAHITTFSTLNFGLYFDNGSTLIYDYSYDSLSNGMGSTISFNQGPSILLLNAAPVATPVPTSLLLLGSGLVGLFGLRRNQSMSQN